nr:PREDICTED: zinc finger and BTB domain-containing protein 25 isoform X2 [Lepisosteus oculatus]XP_015206283.1 PREDICTED: zinc finger and BTB domain-containing protein 25 isoform X2 [Lepisosteus oculatus]
MDVSSHSLFLLQQLNIQREFGFLCDCTVAIGNVYFKAHRAVLAAFSNYFKMIFIHQSSECIKIQPTDIQPDVFSYLLHIMYTGMGPKQQVDQSRLQEGIKFLHAYQLYRNTGEGGQEAASDTIKISNLYGIQISSQMAAKENLGLKENRSRVLEEEMSGTQADRPQIQLSLAVGLEGTSSDRPLSSLHGPSSVTSRDEPEAPNISVTIKQEKTELELSAEPQTSSPQNPESQSPGFFKDSPKPLYCHYCGERCSSRRNLREHLYTHASGSLPFGVPAAILENNNLGEVQKISEDFESLEERHLQSFLVRKSPQSQDQPDSGSLEEALRQSQSLTLSSEELAAELKSGSPYSRKRKIACAICSLRFAQKSQLQEHMYTHTDMSQLESAFKASWSFQDITAEDRPPQKKHNINFKLDSISSVCILEVQVSIHNCFPQYDGLKRHSHYKCMNINCYSIQ